MLLIKIKVNMKRQISNNVLISILINNYELSKIIIVKVNRWQLVFMGWKK